MVKNFPALLMLLVGGIAFMTFFIEHGDGNTF